MYTEKDLREAFQAGRAKGLRPDYNQVELDEDEYINSLTPLILDSGKYVNAKLLFDFYNYVVNNHNGILSGDLIFLYIEYKNEQAVKLETEKQKLNNHLKK
jgi:hypothetical protein